MALYEFKCNNDKCTNKDKLITKSIPISEYSSDNLPECEVCKKNMQRVYSAVGHQTFGDGYKG